MLFFLILFWAVDNPMEAGYKSTDFFVYLAVFVVLYFLYRYQLSFRQGFLMGNVTTLVMVVVSVLFMYLFLGSKSNSVLDTHIKTEIALQENSPSKAKRIEKLNKQGKNGQKIFDDYIQSLKDWKRSSWLSHVIEKEFMSKIFLGIIISLLLSLVLRKYKPKEPMPTVQE
ncbi:hypothetical protein M23134_03450 [Microscilla marina ATCC 23134]|uniref:DUF4199 domain-containing protein n=2 Tax=Microscilla marina TaxID=1027 RepID=A1ZN08_MICM2|nr:hypothetical protein M23134_03450 [Microscilla marina ATCC 23134]